MKIQSILGNQMFSIQLNHFEVIFGGNNHGKTSFIELLYDGFSGKLKKNFLINGEVVEKNQFQVFRIDEYNSFLEEMKIGSKSLLKTTLEERVSNVSKELKEMKQQFETKINEELMYSLDFSDDVTLDFKIDLEEMVLKNTRVKEKEYSFSSLRKLYIETKIHQLSDVVGVLLIDHFDLGFSSYERNQMIKYLKHVALTKNVLVVVTTSNFECFNHNSIFMFQRYPYQNMQQLYSFESLVNISEEHKSLYFSDELDKMYEMKLKEKLENAKELLEKTNIQI